MTGRHPISREIKRQYEQGFLEPKEGLLFPCPLRFKIDCDNEPTLNIRRSGIVYRVKDNYFGRDGAMLRSLPNEAYAPFQDYMEDLVNLMDGVTSGRVSNFRRDEDKWEWRLGDAMTVLEAIKTFRYGHFEINGKNKKGIGFNPDYKPSVNQGAVSVTMPIDMTDFYNLEKIDSIARYLYAEQVPIS